MRSPVICSLLLCLGCSAPTEDEGEAPAELAAESAGDPCARTPDYMPSALPCQLRVPEGGRGLACDATLKNDGRLELDVVDFVVPAGFANSFRPPVYVQAAHSISVRIHLIGVGVEGGVPDGEVAFAVSQGACSEFVSAAIEMAE